MSDRFCAWILIGGKLKRDSVPALCQTLRDCGVRLDWGEAYFEPNDATDMLEARDRKWLRFYDEEARYGEFPELESACRKLGLSYQRCAEAYCGYDAERVDWRLGMRKPLWQRASNDGGNVLVPQAVGKQALCAWTALQSSRPTCQAGRLF
jgi:hypothetical protein